MDDTSYAQAVTRLADHIARDSAFEPLTLSYVLSIATGVPTEVVQSDLGRAIHLQAVPTATGACSLSKIVDYFVVNSSRRTKNIKKVAAIMAIACGQPAYEIESDIDRVLAGRCKGLDLQ